MRGRHLSATNVQKLLRIRSHQPDPELSRALMCTAYTLAGGESLLVFETGKGLLYPDRKELAETHRRRVEEAKRQFFEARPILPEWERFVERVPELVVRLATLIDVPPALLDKTESSLALIDRAIRKLPAERVLDPAVSSALTAYVREVIRALTRGSWDIATGPNGEAIPYIADESGRRYFPSRIEKELLEYGRCASVRAFVAGRVSGRFR